MKTKQRDIFKKVTVLSNGQKMTLYSRHKNGDGGWVSDMNFFRQHDQMVTERLNAKNDWHVSNSKFLGKGYRRVKKAS
jgi:hypothetical protein